MARIVSPVWSSIRGSIAGTTYLSNQYHPIVGRQRVSPVNPSTSQQGIIRSAFAAAVTLWEELTPANRLSWDEYAQTCVFSGPQGNYTISGRLMFIRSLATAQYLITVGVLTGPPNTDPPSIPGFLDVGTIHTSDFLTPASTGIAIGVEYAGSEDVTIYGYRSIPFNQTRERFKGPYISSSISSVDLTGAASAEITYVGLTADLAYFTSWRGINTDGPYRLSAKTLLRNVAVTTV